MEYFESYRKIDYQGMVLTDISQRFNIVNSVVSTKGSTFDYIVKDGDTPEDIAYNFYGDATLHWLILMTNKINDPFYGWFMTYSEVVEHATNSYTDINDIHHYEYDGIHYMELPDGIPAIPITNLDYEVALNENNRTIKVIYKSYLNQIVTEFKDTVNE